MNIETKREVFSWVKAIGIALVIGFILKYFVFRPVGVLSYSMEPTLKEGDVVILWKFGYNFKEPKRGDIIVINNEDKIQDKSLVKRIIGLPKENIKIKDQKVYIDSKELKPDYTDKTTDSSKKIDIVIPKEKYFAMGDNRPNSRDSRDKSVGLIDEDNIEGKVIFRIWPLNRFGTVK
ncbi:signal peptidase I [Dethiothermospora halolimnae]|uniref:signal peptidase I n=1 Tax=Dethiothermospora halolimnae TaxID=3114390 RepID=UPI003CCC02AB